MAKIKELFKLKIDYSKVKRFQLTDDDKELISRERLSVVRQSLIKTVITEQNRPSFSDDLQYYRTYSSSIFVKGKVAIFVNSSIYSAVKFSIDQYIKDLADDGYFATAYTVVGNSSATLRTFIKGISGLVGTLMVGNLPYIAYEDPENSSEVFPCDLYYMDTNGTWVNTDSDSNIESHTGNVSPEIWLGRIWTPIDNGNNTDLINDYFKRNHAYRKGRFGCSERGLAFVDDDWYQFKDCGLSNCLKPSNISTIVNKEDTNCERYKAELSMHRLWSQVCSHSNPSLHSFKINSGKSSNYVYSTYLKDNSAPKAYYHNLFACSNAKYTSANYMGGWYIFDNSKSNKCYGLVAVGSTKTGSMLYFENFYGCLGKGMSIGEAMVEWWKCLGSTHETNEIHWHYGLTILGDPTLTNLSGAVPTTRTPINGAEFDHYPRLTHLSWDAVGLSDVSYEIEYDYNYGIWNFEKSGKSISVKNIKNTFYDMSFVGAQRGRWRVRAYSGTVAGPWSDWSYFRYSR